jgi:ribosomal subunit interface protein
MQINLKATNMELTSAIHDYVEKRVSNLGKILSKIEERGGKVQVNFEVARATNHNKGAEVFHADCLVRIDGQEFYQSADESDLYAAIDEIKEGLFREISKNKDRKQTLFHRGARSVKKMMKGLSDRNPFTSKY